MQNYYFCAINLQDIVRVKKILTILLISLGGLLLSSYIVLQLPVIQTFLAKKVVNSLEDNINGSLKIDKLAIVSLNRIALRGIEIIGSQQDTLTSIEHLYANISINSILRGQIKFKRITVRDGLFYLHTNTENNSTNISDIFGKSERTDSIVKPFPSITVDKLLVDNFRFNLLSTPATPEEEKNPRSIDYKDMYIDKIHISVRDFTFDKGQFKADVKKISLQEKSGFKLYNLSGELSMNKNVFRMDNFSLIDTYSNLKMFPLSFEYDSPKALNSFVEEMRIKAKIRDSKIDFRTIASFTPSLLDNKLSLNIDGDVDGPVAALHLDNFKATTATKKTHIDLRGALIGIPKMETSIFDFQIHNIKTEIPDFHSFISNFIKSDKQNELKIGKDIVCNLTGKVTGILNDLVADINIQTNEGDIAINSNIKDIILGDAILISGKIDTDSLNIGAFLKNELIGETSISTKLSANLDKADFENSTFNINSLKVDNLLLKDYNYSNIIALGSFADNIFDGRLICHDPNLDLIFQGKASIPRKNERENMIFNFYADVPFADINALNLSKESTSRLSFKTNVDISTNSDEEIFGKIDIKNLSYQNSNDKYDIGSIIGSSSYIDENFKIKLTSSFLTASLSGTESPNDLTYRLKEVFLYNNFGNTFIKKGKSPNPDDYGEYHLSVLSHNSHPYAELLAPGLFIADSTYFDLHLSPDNTLKATLDSKLLKLKEQYLKNINLNITNIDSKLVCNLACDKINSGIELDNNLINIGVEDGKLLFDYSYHNNTVDENKMNLSSLISFNKDSLTNKIITTIDMNQSDFVIQGEPWKISKSKIAIAPKDYCVKDFKIYNANQNLSIDGALSENDTLGITLNNFEIDIFNSFIKMKSNLKGKLTGKADIVMTDSNPGILMNIQGTNISAFDNSIGDLSVLSKWDNKTEAFNILINNSYNDRNPLNILGYYRPNNKDINLRVSLDDFSATYFEPFLSSIIHTISGSISGDMQLVGKLDKLNLISNNSKFNNFGFTLDYTNVPYTLNGPFKLNESGVQFNDIKITDKFNKSGRVTGGLRYKYFKDIYLDTRIILNKMHCLNTNEQLNSTYYGDGFGTGIVNLTGPIEELLIDISLNTLENTAVHIPLAGMSNATKTDLLNFISKKDISDNSTYNHITKNKVDNTKKQESELKVNLRIGVENSSTIFLELDKNMGNVIESRGQGVVDMIIEPSKDIFDIRGDYLIEDGKYKFTVLGGVLSKDFHIQPGGTIDFNGDIMKSNLNLETTYKTKTSVSTLIADTSSISNRRPVDCSIKMTGPLSNPNLNFDIDIEDLDPIIQGRVDGALSTDDKILKQFMALLVTGSFIPDEQSSIVNNTAILYSNASEILSNQVNTIFRQLGLPIDLGLNYQPGQTGEDLFDVALSFQAFDNRVIIDGNLGTNNNTSKTGDVTGNFEAQVKLDKQGKLRLSLFTKAADDFSNYLDNSQRHGVGINYQSDFDTFKELWQKLFLTRKKREELELNEMQKYRDEFMRNTEANKPQH